MKDYIPTIRDLLSKLDNGLITQCDFVKSVHDSAPLINWAEWHNAREKELEDSTITLVHFVLVDERPRVAVVDAIEKLREAGYKVSHEENQKFYCISPADSWGSVQRTEGNDPRFLLDIYNSLC